MECASPPQSKPQANGLESQSFPLGDATATKTDTSGNSPLTSGEEVAASARVDQGYAGWGSGEGGARARYRGGQARRGREGDRAHALTLGGGTVLRLVHPLEEAVQRLREAGERLASLHMLCLCTLMLKALGPWLAGAWQPSSCPSGPWSGHPLRVAPPGPPSASQESFRWGFRKNRIRR